MGGWVKGWGLGEGVGLCRGVRDGFVLDWVTMYEVLVMGRCCDVLLSGGPVGKTGCGR